MKFIKGLSTKAVYKDPDTGDWVVLEKSDETSDFELHPDIPVINIDMTPKVYFGGVNGPNHAGMRAICDLAEKANDNIKITSDVVRCVFNDSYKFYDTLAEYRVYADYGLRGNSNQKKSEERQKNAGCKDCGATDPKYNLSGNKLCKKCFDKTLESFGFV